MNYEELYTLAAQVEERLQPIFRGFERTAEKNTKRVLDAFRAHRVSDIIVAIAGRTGEQIVGNAVLCEGGEHLFGIPVTDRLNTGKIRTDFTFGFSAERTDFLGNF